MFAGHITSCRFLIMDHGSFTSFPSYLLGWSCVDHLLHFCASLAHKLQLDSEQTSYLWAEDGPTSGQKYWFCKLIAVAIA
mmetsp:Transcript_14888/g.22310  ORF Transcript_14888/g.22310 Transcript_14888/m.22310 type:complete len:80 (-) Transcript_14888:813-1052(-)